MGQIVKLIISVILFSIGFCNIICSQTGNYDNEFNKSIREYRGLIEKANRSYYRKDFPKALEYYEKAFLIFSDEANDFYKASCCASLMKDTKKAFELLEKSVEIGFIHKDLIIENNEFENLTSNQNWGEILLQLDKEIELLQSTFDELTNVPLENFVPFKENEKWGYVNKTNNEVLVKAKFEMTFPGKSCLTIELSKNNYLKIDKDINFFKSNGTVPNYYYKPKYKSKLSKLRIDSSTNFKGFRVNENGKITHISQKYTSKKNNRNNRNDEIEFIDYEVTSKDKQNIIGPFIINESWHSVVKENNEWFIINTKGEVYEKIPNKYKSLIPVPEYNGKELWFLFEDELSKKGYINLSGKIKFYDEFDTNTNIKMSLSITQKGNLCGVIDLANMEWFIRPKKGEILNTFFTFENDCEKDWSNTSIKRKDLFSIYCLFKDENRNEYFIGEKNKIYTPKK